MDERGRWRRSMALVTLAGALAWIPPSFGVEANQEAQGAPSEDGVPPTLYHTVEPGETLTSIARRFGTSIASLIRENEITDARKIRAGTRVRIPVSAEPAPTLAAKAPSSVDEVAAEGTVAAEGEAATEEKAAVGGSRTNEIVALLERCEAELRAARFEQALASAGEVRARIDAREGAADAASRIRLEIASATVYVALGQHDAALESLERALAIDPSLELDPALTSPKVLAVFRAARVHSAPTH